ncbi:hypothetical protein QI037_02340 [Staphylococcus saprophyticus]|jgi:hypothetical protein|uniref:Uncharacterized protein n=1 Tax=Staphylococcus saprophyticus subsp. saprophyticus (strain ATCC 15305 / DSM 20229 / NCIMB 8711 / NCTC 7292 / S-41) TaxID=342451 RepID=Q49Y62_STAS1|nr:MULTISPECIES: hypothetical protein [Staphylococcus]CRV16915.1 Uncharacterised protein [Streptococcus equi subsp. equi]MBC2920696.1 hypothetical protein [Staphylococcus saprophyticus]MBC2956400.1 hypothetical protein [Staphylococcus saprophyticus]MBC3009476.1 hypothetical protein [Staphylococcus saprophyticus]MBC3023355.1 hypothetical protein [Staphylococcus saprophyticus]
MAENFSEKAKETAKTVSDKLKDTDNEKAKQASEQIDKFTGGSDNDNKDYKKEKDEK